MNIKIKLTIAGQELELTIDEAQELKAALDRILPLTLAQLHKYRAPALVPLTAPAPHFHQPGPTPIPRITCDAGGFVESAQPDCRYV